MNIENVKSQMRKGILEYCILLILDRKRVYVSDIISSFKQSQLIVVEGTLYPLMTRLKNSEMVSYQWEESSSGPPRKYYQITEKGRLFLSELQHSWDELNLVVQRVKYGENE